MPGPIIDGSAEPPDDNAALIPQRHGGALYPPSPGQHGPGKGVAANRTSFRAVRKEVFSILAEAAPEGARRLAEMTRSTDERVAVASIQILYERVFGKAGNGPMEGEERAALPDLSHLTPEERRELHAALCTIHRLTGRGSDGLGESG